MTKIDASIKDILIAASWCDHNGLEKLAYAFDGFATDSLPLSSNKKLASIHNKNLSIKTASSHIKYKNSFGSEKLDDRILYAVGKSIEGGIPSMNRVAFDLGKGVSTLSDISGLIPGIGAYTRGIGNLVGGLMQGQGIGESLKAGAIGFGLGSLPAPVQIGIKGITVLINYLQTLDMSKMPWLQSLLPTLQKWVPMIGSGIGYAMRLGYINPKEKTDATPKPSEAPSPVADGEQAPTPGDKPLADVIPFPQRGGTGQTPDVMSILNKMRGGDQPLAQAADVAIDKMIKTSGKKEDYSWILFDLVDSQNKNHSYGILPKDLYRFAISS